jgi:plasmid stabilization system protein ParE
MIRYARSARLDLVAILEFLMERDPGAAERTAERIEATIANLADGLFDGPEQRLLTGELLRSWAVPPFRVYYDREGDDLVVVRIFHQSRQPITK